MSASAPDSPKRFSIVINTLDRAALLRTTLDSLRYLDHRNFETIVVNGPSTDDTDAVLAAWRDRIKIGHCSDKNLAMSRNIGIAMAAGAFVCFIDDDALPEPEWLSQLDRAFADDEVGAAGGRVFDNSGYSFQFQFANSNRLGTGKWRLTAPSPHYCFPGAYEFPYLQGTNAAFRRAALLEIGGFDEAFEYYLDETDVCLRLIDRGYTIRQLDNAYVHHKFAPSHLRTRTTATHRYPVLKSKIYFSLRHGAPYRDRAAIDRDNDVFVAAHRRDVTQAVADGRLSESDRETFETHIVQASAAAAALAAAPPRLIDAALATAPLSAFHPFPTLRARTPPQIIVLLCEDYPPALLGGIARVTQDKATALARLGHKVHVIARGAGVNTVDFEHGVWVHRIDAARHAPSDAARVLRVPSWLWDQSQSFLDELDRIATHRPIDIVEAPVWNIVGIAVLLSGRYRLALSLQTTLKLSLSSRADLTGSRRAMRNLVAPLIGIERYMIEHADGVIANSRGIVREIEGAYGIALDPARLYLCHHGMPDWRAAASPEPAGEFPRDIVEILFVGRLERRKGIDVLLAAIPAIAASHPRARFHIVGDDTIKNADGTTYRAAFQRAHPELSGSRAIFHGKLDDDALRRRYAACDVFVAPSRFESFGLIYLEAMMFEKPVIGCAAGGVPEIVEDGTTGLLVPPGDAVELRRAIVALIDDPARRAAMGRRGRLSYEADFTAERMAAESVAIYRAAIDSPPGAIGR